MDALFSYDSLIRLGSFLGVFAVIAIWEYVAPRRPQAIGRALRWPSNLALVLINTALLRLVVPITAVAFAVMVESQGAGLLRVVGAPRWLAIPTAFVLLDLAIYLQHVLFHSVPVLWRLHRMHHADVEFDVTNGLRFHPLEMVLSTAIKLSVIAAVGAPPEAVLAFEVVLNGAAMFNHGNIALPVRLDRILRWFIVTPDMHRVHHSSVPEETHSNFGFNLPWWDRWFGTYVAQPRKGHARMELGLTMFRAHRWLRLDQLLLQPWVGPAGPLRGSRGSAAAPAK
jgi:sterol desaturase/sphingolipid hydroxylase (fatty acid hydroxylase superfamily)